MLPRSHHRRPSSLRRGQSPPHAGKRKTRRLLTALTLDPQIGPQTLPAGSPWFGCSVRLAAQVGLAPPLHLALTLCTFNARRLSHGSSRWRHHDIWTPRSFSLVLPPHEALELIQVRTCTHETSRVSAFRRLHHTAARNMHHATAQSSSSSYRSIIIINNS